MRVQIRLADLFRIRKAVYACALGAGLSAARTESLVVAVNEAITNSIQHSGGDGELVLSCEDNQLVAEITDTGQGPVQPVPTQVPPLDAERGRGLWLVRELVDRVSVRRSPRGTTLRLEVALGP